MCLLMGENEAIKKEILNPRSTIGNQSFLFKSVDDGPLISQPFIKRFSRENGEKNKTVEGRRKIKPSLDGKKKQPRSDLMLLS